MNEITRIVVIVGIYFLILFTASTSYGSILTKIFEEEGETKLAPTSFISNSISALIANLFAPLVKFPEKWLMAVVSLVYALQYATGFFMFGDNETIKYIFIVVGASLSGIATSFLWVSLGRYIHKACHLYRRESEKGHYFGMFNSIYFFNCVLGGIVITFGLEIMSHQNYFIMVTCIAGLAFLFAVLLIKNIKYEEVEEADQTEPEMTWKHILFSTLKFYPTMLPILGLVFLDGTNIAINASTIIHLITKTDDKDHDDLFAGIAIITFGFGSLIGGYVGGKLCDKFRLRRVALVGVLLYGIMCTSVFAASFISSYPLTLLVFFYFGFQYSYITGCLFVICSRTFKGAPQSFAITKQFHSFAYVLYEIVALSTGNSIPIKYIMPFLLIFTVPACMGLCRLPAEDSKKESLVETD